MEAGAGVGAKWDCRSEKRRRRSELRGRERGRGECQREKEGRVLGRGGEGRVSMLVRS